VLPICCQSDVWNKYFTGHRFLALINSLAGRVGRQDCMYTRFYGSVDYGGQFAIHDSIIGETKLTVMNITELLTKLAIWSSCILSRASG
jgi:hypothetical protein